MYYDSGGDIMRIDAEMQERMILEELSSRFKQYRIKNR